MFRSLIWRLVALMLVLGRMYVDHEMSVLFSSGISRGQLTRLMLPLILVLLVLEAGISLWAKPWGVRHSEQIWQQQALTSALDLIRPKTFISSGDYHLYVGAFDKEKRELNDLYVVQRPTNAKGQALGKEVIITAQRAVQVPTNPNASMTQLDLFNGRRYEIGANSQAYSQVSFDSYRISLEKPEVETINENNVEIQHTNKLINNLDKPEVKAELGYRLSLPWLIVIAAMLATPLAQVRPRQGRWLRLLPSILIFVSCAIGIMSLKTAISKDKLGVMAYAWLIIGFMLFALYLNWQTRAVHRIRYYRRSNNSSRATSGGQS